MQSKCGLFLGLIASVVVFSLACGESPAEDRTATSQVLASTECLPPSCVSIEEASAALGFAVLEPQALPEGFRLDGRELYRPRSGEIPLRLPQGGQGTVPIERAEPPARLVITYRFEGSVNVPPIVLTESRPGPSGTDLRLMLVRSDCGELIEDAAGQRLYADGFVTTEPGRRDGELLVCAVAESPARHTHTVLVTRAEVLVEILAFPESGVSREDILRLAESLVEAE